MCDKSKGERRENPTKMKKKIQLEMCNLSAGGTSSVIY